MEIVEPQFRRLLVRIITIRFLFFIIIIEIGERKTDSNGPAQQRIVVENTESRLNTQTHTNTNGAS